jgi:hypothetical protein
MIAVDEADDRKLVYVNGVKRRRGQKRTNGSNKGQCKG